MTTVLIATDGGAANNAETIDCANEYYKNSTHQQTTTLCTIKQKPPVECRRPISIALKLRVDQRRAHRRRPHIARRSRAALCAPMRCVGRISAAMAEIRRPDVPLRPTMYF
jgi:hypothetical protein